jgi:hypothetical protein
MTNEAMQYDDGRIACDDMGLIIRWYYLWGSKTIPYASIKSIKDRPLTGLMARWRIWGSADFVHWYNLDGSRRHKDVSLEIDTGGRIRPTITPDDPEAVVRIVTEKLAR